MPGRAPAHRYLARFAALAEHANPLGMEVVEIERGQFGQAQAAGIEQFQHGLVAACQGRAVMGRVEKVRERIDIHGTRKVAGYARGADQRHGIVVQVPLGHQVFGETRQGRAAPGQAARR